MASCDLQGQALLEALQHIAALPGMPAPLVAAGTLDALQRLAASDSAIMRATCKTIEALLLLGPAAESTVSSRVSHCEAWTLDVGG